MKLFDKLFGKPTANLPIGHFCNLVQQELNILASMLPMAMDLIRSPGNATVIIQDISASQATIVRGLTEAQYKELREIQEIFRLATVAPGNTEKLKLYLRCIERAPWHCYALKSAGVCYYIAGDKRRACDYLKRAVELSPDDENIRTNYQRVLKEV